jgi:hypothetical protein
LVASDDTNQGIEVRLQQILATQTCYDPLFRPALVPIGLNESDVLLDGAIFVADFNGAEIHNLSAFRLYTIWLAKSTKIDVNDGC